MENSKQLDGPHSGYGYQWRKYHAEVYTSIDDTGEVVAIKKSFFRFSEHEAHKAICREIFLLWQIKDHRHVIRLHKLRCEGEYCYLHLDYFEFNLEKFITPPCSPLSPSSRKKYLKQILIGIAHCHSIPIIHRHLSPRFVLVDPREETVKISEFGEAVLVGAPEMNSRLVNQNLGYRAPEVIFFSRVFYCCGCVVRWLYFCCNGTPQATIPWYKTRRGRAFNF